MHQRIAALTTVLASVGLTIMVACQNAQPGAAPSPTHGMSARALHTGAAADSQTTVVVDNQSFNDVDMYVLPQTSTRLRLGTAIAHTKTTLVIPSSVIFGPTTLRFIARPIAGSRLPISDEIVVTKGDEVDLIIPPV